MLATREHKHAGLRARRRQAEATCDIRKPDTGLTPRIPRELTQTSTAKSDNARFKVGKKCEHFAQMSAGPTKHEMERKLIVREMLIKTAARYPVLLPKCLAGTEQMGNTKHQGYQVARAGTGEKGH